MKLIELKQKIVGSKNFEEEFIKNLLESVLNERMESENLERQTLAYEFQLEKETREREFQLECLRVKWDTFVTKSIELFVRQAKVLQFPKDQWVTYLIGVLPVEVNNIIAREPEEQASGYEHIKEVLLKRFKLSTEKSFDNF
ncbi:retrovirus-related Pol polyprotein from transposon 17.6 [Trichonephila clavipes]|nr:retrovirus-related Pol polyprotein from transposon 17.6 [Trichonephila clavipes]